MADREQVRTNELGQEFKFYAFISYNSKDTEWGKRLQRKLEHYRMPSTVCSERGWKRTPIRPVFFAPTDIQPGGLNEELKERLLASRNLIVICSPNSARSEWVGKEIEYFHSLGRTDSIHFFIVDGIPHSGDPDTECFNPVVETLGLPEILGANINEKNFRWPWLNKERGYVQLISKLLGVEFDAIWKRHKRRLISRIISWTVGAIAILASLAWVWASNQPFDAKVSLNEASVHNGLLPPLHDIIVTLSLDNETKTDTFQEMGDMILFSNIPHKFLNKPVRIKLQAPEYVTPEFIPVDTTVVLTRNVIIDIKRDPYYYGDIHFRLWNPNTEKFIPNTPVEVDGHKIVSDQNGQVKVFIPLEAQRTAYQVKTAFPLIEDSIYAHASEDAVIQKR